MPLRLPDHPDPAPMVTDAPIAPRCLLDMALGWALLEQGMTPDQAADYLRHAQAVHAAAEPAPALEPIP